MRQVDDLSRGKVRGGLAAGAYDAKEKQEAGSFHSQSSEVGFGLPGVWAPLREIDHAKAQSAHSKMAESQSEQIMNDEPAEANVSPSPAGTGLFQAGCGFSSYGEKDDPRSHTKLHEKDQCFVTLRVT
jgi:hypothetical protein